ncbi:MAG: M16 family metallopeptidase, partial [Flavobacteriales bacterium]
MFTGFHRWACSCAAALGGLLFPALMTAQLDRSLPPPPGPAPLVRLGEHITSTLPNGMRIIVVEDHKLPLVSVQVRFDIPPIHQGEQVGYIDLFGELLAAGAGARTKAEIDRSVDAIGANLYTSNDGLFASVLKKNLGPLMDVVRDVIVEPTFPQEELESAVTRARSSVQQRKEDPEAIAEVVGRSVMFGRAHPYGEVITEGSLDKIDRARLEAYHRHFFRPTNAYLVFVGDLTEKEAKDLAKKHFGKWDPKPSKITQDEYGRTLVDGLGAVVPLQKATVPSGVRRVYVVDRPGAAQSVVRVLFPLAIVPKDIRAQQAQVMNTILGGGIFNARLMQNLRERNGFTYGCYSNFDVDRFNSSFVATTSVRTEVTDQAVKEILVELENMRKAPVTTEELELAKRSMMGSFGRSLEDPRTVARFALNTQLSGLPADHYATYLTRLESITAQQIQDVANTFLHPDQASVLVVGDLERIKAGLKGIGMDPLEPIIQLTDDGERWQEVLIPVTDRTAEQVVETYLHAIGGRDRIAPMRQLALVYDQQRGEEAFRYEEWFGPDQYRSKLQVGAELVEEFTFDGQRVLYFDGANKGEMTDAGFEMVRLLGRPVPEVAYRNVLEKAELLGRTKLNGKEVYKLTMTYTSGNSFQVYFDKESGLKVRLVEEQFYNSRVYRRVVDFADWKPIAGVLFPHLIVEEGGVSGPIRSVLSASTVNQAMPKGFFDVVIPEVKDEPVPPE